MTRFVNIEGRTVNPAHIVELEDTSAYYEDRPTMVFLSNGNSFASSLTVAALRVFLQDEAIEEPKKAPARKRAAK